MYIPKCPLPHIPGSESTQAHKELLEDLLSLTEMTERATKKGEPSVRVRALLLKCRHLERGISFQNRQITRTQGSIKTRALT